MSYIWGFIWDEVDLLYEYLNCQCKMKLRLIHLWYHYNNLNVTRGSEFLEMERKNKRPRTEPEEEDMDIGNEKQLLSVLIYFLGIIWVFVMEGSGGGIFLIWIRDKFWSFLFLWTFLISHKHYFDQTLFLLQVGWGVLHLLIINQLR